MKKHLPLFNLLPFAVMIILFMLAPLLWIVINSFKNDMGLWGLEQYHRLFENEFYVQSIYLSLKLSFWPSLMGIIIALIGAHSLYTMRYSRLNRIILSFNSMTSNFSGVPLAFAFIIILGTNGVFTLLLRPLGWDKWMDLYSMSGLIITYTYFQIPLGILLLYPAFDAIKPQWKEAATLMGAGPIQYILKIVLPVLRPAILGTFTILMANALGAYATIYALTMGNFNILPIRISSLVAGDVSLDPHLASALSMILMLLMLIICLVHYWMNRSYLKVTGK